MLGLWLTITAMSVKSKNDIMRGAKVTKVYKIMYSGCLHADYQERWTGRYSRINDTYTSSNCPFHSGKQCQACSECILFSFIEFYLFPTSWMPGFLMLTLKVWDSSTMQIVFLPTCGLLLWPVKHSNLKALRGFKEITQSTVDKVCLSFVYVENSVTTLVLWSHLGINLLDMPNSTFMNPELPLNHVWPRTKLCHIIPWRAFRICSSSTISTPLFSNTHTKFSMTMIGL